MAATIIPLEEWCKHPTAISDGPVYLANRKEWKALYAQEQRRKAEGRGHFKTQRTHMVWKLQQ